MNRKRDKAKPTRFKGVHVIEPGTMYLVRGTWVDPKTDRKRSFREQIEAPDAEAAAAIRLDMLREKRAGIEAEPVPRLLDFAKSWLNSKRREVKPSTHEKYTYAIAHISEAFGDHYLDRILASDVQRWRDSLPHENGTINGWLGVFKNMMSDAVRLYRLPFDPTEGVRLLPVEKTSKCLSETELNALLRAMLEVAPQWYPLTLTLAMTGMRPGAATALRWCDIDFERKCITVDHAHWRGIVGETKTRNIRELGLPDELAEVLRPLRRVQMADQHAGLAEGWVFATDRGTLRNAGVLRKPLLKACKAAGISKPVSPGWFRHTLSNLVQRRAGMRVQKAITGHTTDRMAFHYSDVALNERLAVVAEIAAKVAPKVAHSAGGDGGDGSEA